MRLIVILISLGIVGWLIYTYSSSGPASLSRGNPAQTPVEAVNQARDTARNIEKDLQQHQEMIQKRAQ